MQNYVADTQNSGQSVDIIVFATRVAALRQLGLSLHYDSVPALVMMYIAGIHTWWMRLPLHTTPWLPAVTPAGMGNDFADMLQDLGDAEGISSMQLQHFPALSLGGAAASNAGMPAWACAGLAVQYDSVWYHKSAAILAIVR